MKINKQLFEDVLSGKLKGTFVLKNGKRLNDNLLTDIYKSTVVLGKTTFYFNGKPIVSDYNGILDIIDFIPDTDMKENELTIEIPNGKIVDWEESQKQNKIVFKKKDTKPRSWKEYCCTRLDNKETRFGYRIGCNCEIVTADWDNLWNCSTWRDVLPSKELVEAFLAMMQLMSLRQAWIGDWEPDWKDFKQLKAAIRCNCNGEFIVMYFNDLAPRPLSFPTKEMAEDFMNTFKDLLNLAKDLL